MPPIDNKKPVLSPAPQRITTAQTPATAPVVGKPSTPAPASGWAPRAPVESPSRGSTGFDAPGRARGVATPVAPPTVDAHAQIATALKSGPIGASRLSAEVLALATGDERVAVLKALTPPPSNEGQQGMNQGQTDEAAVLRVFSAATDAGQLDYLTTRVDVDTLRLSMMGGRQLDKQRATLGGPTPGDWGGYAKYLEGATGQKTSGKNKLEFLIDGAEVSPKGMEMLAGATQSINLSVFEFQADEVGNKVADLLGKKAQEGVKVRVLVDEYGTEGADKEAAEKMIAGMRAKGVDVIVNPTNVLKAHLDHRKVLVVDGARGFTGGMNIGENYQRKWHDQQTRVEGPAVSKLQDAFLAHWKRESGADPAPDELKKLYPPLTEASGGVETYVIPHEGDSKDQNIKAAYLRAIGTAQTSIDVATPYFADKEVIASLCDAAKRGVKVRVVLPAENDVSILKRVATAAYPDLIKSGVEVYEYQGRMAHEKVATIDGQWSTFGSSNLDGRSLKENDELNAVVLDPGVAKDIKARLFDVDVAKSTRITESHPSLRENLDRLLGKFL